MLVWLNGALIRVSKGFFAYQIFLRAAPTATIDALLDDSIGERDTRRPIRRRSLRRPVESSRSHGRPSGRDFRSDGFPQRETSAAIGPGGVVTSRGAIVVAQLVFQGQLVLLTEVTSAFHRFDVRTIVSAWLVSIVVLLLFGGSGLFRAVRSFPSRIRWPQGIGAWDSIFIAAIVAVFATLIVVGWRYPPANGDSMVYHLPRAMQWIQNGSVAHFATHYVAQLELAPLHEFNLAHLHLFASGTDRFDGYVQLIALAISAIGASEMARLLGAGRSGQVLAALVCVTAPSAILEATSTQNNVFAASIGLGNRPRPAHMARPNGNGSKST